MVCGLIYDHSENRENSDHNCRRRGGCMYKEKKIGECKEHRPRSWCKLFVTLAVIFIWKSLLWQKTFVTFSGFWLLTGWEVGVWVNPLKKENLWRKSFFSDVEWSSKISWKMISANVKDNKTTKNKKIWWLYLTNFYKKYLQNLKYNVKNFG